MKLQTHQLDSYPVYYVEDLLSNDSFDRTNLTIMELIIAGGGHKYANHKKYYNTDSPLFLLFDSINVFLESQNIKSQLSGFTALRNTKRNMLWHRHWGSNVDNDDTIPQNKFWVVTYYPNRVYDLAFAGNIRVSKSGNDNELTFPCTPNSCVIHSGLFGHRITDVSQQDSTEARNVIYSQWVVI